MILFTSINYANYKKKDFLLEDIKLNLLKISNN